MITYWVWYGDLFLGRSVARTPFDVARRFGVTVRDLRIIPEQELDLPDWALADAQLRA